MKVIMAGYSKTGTKTMAEAMRLLGYNVHDTMENFYYHDQLWYDVMSGKAGLDEIREAYKGVDAVVDYPAYLFWQQFVEAFPEAKIIFTQRDEDKWVRSAIHQHREMGNNRKFIFLLTMSWTGWRMFRFWHIFLGLIEGPRPLLPFTSWPDSEVIRRISYRKHNASVLLNAPKERLLVYDVTQGRDPLCEFLDLEKPSIDFPRKNVNASIFDDRWKHDPIFQKMEGEAFVLITAMSFHARLLRLVKMIFPLWRSFFSKSTSKVTCPGTGWPIILH